MGNLASIDLDIPFYIDILRGKCIGFGGKLMSGKTYLSDCLMLYITKVSDVRVIRHSFGGELRSFIHHSVGIPVGQMKRNGELVTNGDRKRYAETLIEHLDGRFIFDADYIKQRLSSCSNYDDVYRFVLQYVGTEIYRTQVDTDHWVKAVERNLDSKAITIIDDIRFPNELNMVKNNGFALYSVMLENYGTSDDLVASHASEVSVQPEDFEMIYWNRKSSKPKPIIGQDVFNHAASGYYLFKQLKNNLNKEKFFIATIKST